MAFRDQTGQFGAWRTDVCGHLNSWALIDDQGTRNTSLTESAECSASLTAQADGRYSGSRYVNGGWDPKRASKCGTMLFDHRVRLPPRNRLQIRALSDSTLKKTTIRLIRDDIVQVGRIFRKQISWFGVKKGELIFCKLRRARCQVMYNVQSAALERAFSTIVDTT